MRGIAALLILAAVLGCGSSARAATIAEALDQPGWSFATGGNAPWLADTGTTHDGTDAAASGEIGIDERSWLETTRTFTGRSILAFWVKISAESGCNSLRLLVDGDPVLEYESAMDWQLVTRAVRPGTHTLRWEFDQYCFAPPYGRAWIDAVAIEAVPQGTPAPALAEAVDQPAWVFSTSADSPWTAQGETTWDGSDAAETAPLLDTAPSWFEATVTLPSDGLLTFRWKFSPAGWDDLLVFAVDGTPVAEIQDSWVDWAPVSVALGAGTHTLSWECWPGPWGAPGTSARVDVVQFTPSAAPVSLAAALDQPDWEFTVGGSGLWEGQTARTHDGSDAAESGSIGAGESAWFETTRDFDSSGTVAFWWKVSSDLGVPLRFLVDGTLALEVDGVDGWRQFSWLIPAGTHTLRWEYRKSDWGGAANADAAWVDGLSFTPTGAVYRELRVASSEDGEWGKWAYLDPPDVHDYDQGVTPFSRLYPDGAVVAIEIEEYGDQCNGLAEWTGCDSVNGTTCQVTLTADREIFARYFPVPVLRWRDDVGGAGSDAGLGIALAADGTVWAAGTTSEGGAKAWLASYTGEGTPLWQGSSTGKGADVAAAPDGGAYLVGTSGGRLLLRKHAPDGTILWTRTHAGAGNGVAVSPDGTAVYVTGVSNGDILVQKYTAEGRLAWTRRAAGNLGKVDEGKRVAVADDGSVVVVGYVQRSGKGKSIWIRNYAAGGAVLWTKTVDGVGRGADWAGGLVIRGNVLYVTGAASTGATRQLWAAAYLLDGSPLWSGVWGDEDVLHEGTGIAVSPAGTIDIVGTRRWPDDPDQSFRLLRLRPDGRQADCDFMEIEDLYDYRTRSGGIACGTNGCYFIGSAWGDSSDDIFVGEYRHDAGAATPARPSP